MIHFTLDVGMGHVFSDFFWHNAGGASRVQHCCAGKEGVLNGKNSIDERRQLCGRSLEVEYVMVSVG